MHHWIEPLNEHFYSDDEKRENLRKLAGALHDLVQMLPGLEAFSAKAPHYQQCEVMTNRLLEEGFQQQDLRELHTRIEPLIFCHPWWDEPPEWLESTWYPPFREIHGRVMQHCAMLVELGEY